MKIVRESNVTSVLVDPTNWSAGGVWRADPLVTATNGLRGNRFTYAPAQRSNWHIHEGEQALIVLSGRGLILWEGLETAEVLEPGDWVHVSPGTPHWHGAVPDNTFVHVAVTASGDTLWRDAVDDAAYHRSLPDDL